MKKITPASYDAEFKEFLNSTDTSVPAALSIGIKDHIKKDLNPSKLFVLSKVFIIQFFTGLSTLFICSQFGLSFFGIEGLWPLFQKLGNTACMTLCGGLFIGSGTLITMLVLKPEEIRTIWKEKIILYLLLSLFFIAIFYFLGTQHNNQTMFTAWLIGSFIASQVILNLVKAVRFPDWDPLSEVMV